MTNQLFIDTIVGLYKDAKKTAEAFAIPNKIKRGRNHSISSLTEDVLAFFITQRCESADYRLMVDYPISFSSLTKKTDKGNPVTVTIYPDISIVKQDNSEQTVVAMIDLKMDLGWKREFDEYLEKMLPALEELRKVGAGRYKEMNDDGEKQKYHTHIRISSSLKWHVPIISNQNIGERKMAQNLIAAGEACYEDKVFLYIFSSVHHPNSPFPPTVDEKAMDDFIADLSAAL